MILVDYLKKLLKLAKKFEIFWRQTYTIFHHTCKALGRNNIYGALGGKQSDQKERFKNTFLKALILFFHV